MNTLSTHRPRPSMEMRTSAALNTSVNSDEVNWLPWDALLKVKLFLSATRVPLPGTPGLQGTNATTSAGTAVLDCPGGSTGTSRPLRFAARRGRSASGAGPSYGLPGQSRALPAWPAVETSMAENWPSRVKLRLRPDEFPVIVV